MADSELKSVDIEDCKQTNGSNKSSVLMGVANLVNFTIGNYIKQNELNEMNHINENQLTIYGHFVWKVEPMCEQ